MAGPTSFLHAPADTPHTHGTSARIIVLGDLHIGAGADPLEHFFHDGELAGLIARVAAHSARRKRRCTLVLNGDVFDFVRTVRLPSSEAEVTAWRSLLEAARVRVPAGALEAASQIRFTALERRYGLDATEHESVWKLGAMAQGHPRVFAALAQWLQAGHELVVVRGNHDVEWAWPGVRRALRVLLERAAGTAFDHRRLYFRMHGWQRHNVRIEHGQSIRWSTHVEGRFSGNPRRRLKQPFGSYINRFVLNPFERLASRAPNVTSSAHLKRQLQSDPFRLWRMLLRHAFRALPPLGRATWRIWHRRTRHMWPIRLGNAVALGVLLAPLFAPGLLAALSLDSFHTRTGAALLALATPHLGLALLETLSTVRDDTQRRARGLARRVAARRRGDGERVVILGHTHRPELVTWESGATRVVYANPGCWMDEEGGARGRGRFVWCAWNGRAYTRTRILEIDSEAGRCRTHSKS